MIIAFSEHFFCHSVAENAENRAHADWIMPQLIILRQAVHEQIRSILPISQCIPIYFYKNSSIFGGRETSTDKINWCGSNHFKLAKNSSEILNVRRRRWPGLVHMCVGAWMCANELRCVRERDQVCA